MADGIDNNEDVIDSRDVIERIKELREDREAFETEADGSPTTWEEKNFSDAVELAALESLADEASGCAPDWEYGTTLIRDSYFVEYAQQLAEDIGAIDRDMAWPACHIDWEAAADALKMDYTAVDFDGVSYWVR